MDAAQHLYVPAHQPQQIGRVSSASATNFLSKARSILIFAVSPATGFNPSSPSVRYPFFNRFSANFQNVPGRFGRTTPLMSTALRDYSTIAISLFNNLRVPAAVIAGAAIPLGFAAAPKPDRYDTRMKRFLKVVHLLLALVTIGTELMTILWSTVSLNKLAEVAVAPSNGVMELLARDFELQWLGCNVHFFLGLCSLAAMTGFNVLINFGAALGRIGAFSSGAGVFMMISILNDGIAQGDGTGARFGMNVFSIVRRYLQLLFARAARGHLLLAASLGLAVMATVAALIELLQCRSCEDIGCPLE